MNKRERESNIRYELQKIEQTLHEKIHRELFKGGKWKRKE